MCLITAQWDEVVSSRGPEGVLLAACGYFLPVCVSSPTFSLLVPPQTRDTIRGELDSDIYYLRWRKRWIWRNYHCVHGTWSDPLCRQYFPYAANITAVFVSFTGPFYNMTPEERMDADNRSVYVGNVRCICLFLLYEKVFHTSDLTILFNCNRLTMELLQMSWRSISMAVVPSTEWPSCVTGSQAIQRGG